MKLSKTNFITYLDCRKNAWLKIHRPDIYYEYPLSSFEQNIIETGNEIDVLARDLFPGGVLIEDREDNELTQQLIDQQTKVIYQPVFTTDKFLTACDILVWNDDNSLYDLYEVKSSTASATTEGSSRATKEYLTDIAFQKTVLTDSDVTVGQTYLIRLNKAFVRTGNINLQELFLIEDVSEEVEEIANTIADSMTTAYDYLVKETEPQGYCECILRGLNSHCTTSAYSIPDLPDYPIHAIARLGNSKTKFAELVDSDTLDIQDIESGFFKVGSNYALQVGIAQSGIEHIDHARIADFIADIEYPISYLDYETYPSAIPRFEGYKPYQQIPFQFSLHVQQAPDSKLEHFEFLHVDSAIPDHNFVEALQNCLPTTGSIIVWNKTFECKIINSRLIERHPHYTDYFTEINDRVVDLMIPFSGNKKAGINIMYQHPDQRGSYSIKAVLPIFAPELSYKSLGVQDGGTASDTWNRIVCGEFSDSERETKCSELLDYCELDTLAMVKILERLRTI